MLIENRLIAYTLLALLVALVVSFLMTPIVKTFAYKVGAIDVPKDARRMHKTPIPRLGGLAIFIGFMVSILLFVEITAGDAQHPAGSRYHRGAGRGGRHHGPAGAAEICGADRGRPDPGYPRCGDPGAVQPQRLFRQPLLGAGKSLRAPDGALDRCHHQRGEPDRRPGRPGQRRLRHLRHHSAGDRPHRRRRCRWPWSWPPWWGPAWASCPTT